MPFQITIDICDFIYSHISVANISAIKDDNTMRCLINQSFRKKYTIKLRQVSEKNSGSFFYNFYFILTCHIFIFG